MEKEKKVTLKDIASSLNVSINTVSHALRDLDDISEKEKDRIRKEAIRLGYASKKFDLRYLKKYSVCLIFDSFLNPYFAYMGERLRLKLNDKGFDIVVRNLNVGKLTSLLHHLFQALLAPPGDRTAPSDRRFLLIHFRNQLFKHRLQNALCHLCPLDTKRDGFFRGFLLHLVYHLLVPGIFPVYLNKSCKLMI